MSALILLSLTMLVACGGAEPDGGADPVAAPGSPGAISEAPATDDDPKEIVIALAAEPPNLDAHVSSEQPTEDVYHNVMESLLTNTTEGAVPVLAAGMPEQVEDTRWRVELQEGVTFHDGTPFDAEAAVANIERVIDPETESTLLGRLSSIVGAEVVDEQTIEIITDRPDPLLPRRLHFIMMMPPEHFGTDPNFAENPIGTGPYRFVEWRRGDALVLERNDDYWGEQPPIDTVTFRFLEEYGTRLASLLSGESDVIMNLTPDDYEQVPKAAQSTNNGLVMYLVNGEQGPTQDVRVRQALQHAIDKDAVAENLYAGFASLVEGQILDETWFGHDPSAEDYEFDMDQARALIEEAGASGQPLRVVGGANRWAGMDELLEYVTAQWTEIGLDAQLDIREAGVYVDILLGEEPPRPEVIFAQTENEFLDADRSAQSWLHGGSNRALNHDAELDAIIDEAALETDEDRRLELYHEMSRITRENAYAHGILAAPQRHVAMGEHVQWEPGVSAWPRVAQMDITE